MEDSGLDQIVGLQVSQIYLSVLLVLSPSKQSEQEGWKVVSIGAILTFKVIFTPLEYVLIIPPLSSYVINICFVLFK